MPFQENLGTNKYAFRSITIGSYSESWSNFERFPSVAQFRYFSVIFFRIPATSTTIEILSLIVWRIRVLSFETAGQEAESAFGPLGRYSPASVVGAWATNRATASVASSSWDMAQAPLRSGVLSFRLFGVIRGATPGWSENSLALRLSLTHTTHETRHKWTRMLWFFFFFGTQWGCGAGSGSREKLDAIDTQPQYGRETGRMVG